MENSFNLHNQHLEMLYFDPFARGKLETLAFSLGHNDSAVLKILWRDHWHKLEKGHSMPIKHPFSSFLWRRVFFLLAGRERPFLKKNEDWNEYELRVGYEYQYQIVLFCKINSSHKYHSMLGETRKYQLTKNRYKY